MRRGILAVACLLFVGCIADIRLPAYAVGEHLDAVRTITRAVDTPPQERLELVEFHVDRAKAWSLSIIRQKGELPADKRFTIPFTPDDEREVNEETLRLKEHNANVDAEQSLKAKATGWLGMLGGGVGGVTSIGGVLALFLRYKKRVTGMLRQKDRAIDEYDAAIQTLPQAKRKAIATGAALKREHAIRRNGG